MMEDVIGVSIFLSIIVLVVDYQHFKAMTKEGGER